MPYPILLLIDTIDVYALKCRLIDDSSVHTFELGGLAQSSSAIALYAPAPRKSEALHHLSSTEWEDPVLEEMREIWNYLNQCFTQQIPVSKFYFCYFELVPITTLSTQDSVDQVLLNELTKH